MRCSIVLVLVSVLPSITLAQANDSAVCKIDGRVYNHRELFGVSVDEMKAEYQQNVKTVSDDDMRVFLRNAGYYMTHKEGEQVLANRADLEKALFDTVYSKALDQVGRHLLLAHITERILRQHGTSMDEFFNMKEIKGAVDRQARLLECLYKNAKAPPKDSKLLYATATQECDTSLSEEEFANLRRIIADRPFYSQWPVRAFIRSGRVDDYYAKAFIAHYLLKDACEKGVYRESAKSIFQQKNSSMVRVAIDGYTGPSDTLAGYFAIIINKDGDIAAAGVKVLDAWFRRMDLPVSLKVDVIFAADSLSDAPGVLCRTGEHRYEICAWMTKVEREPGTESQKAGYETFMTVYAYEAAAKRYMPSFQSAIRDWQPDVVRLVQAVSVDGKALICPEVKAGEFITKAYPGVLFQDMEDNRAAVEELTIRAASCVARKDISEAATIKSLALTKKGEAKTLAVKTLYDRLVKQLDNELSTTQPSDQAASRKRP